MTTLPDRPNTALVVIDVQNGVVAHAHERDAVVANINELVGRARGAGVPVVWVQHSDEDLSAWGAPSPGKVIAHTNMYWGEQSAPGRTAAVAKTEDVSFSA